MLLDSIPVLEQEQETDLPEIISCFVGWPDAPFNTTETEDLSASQSPIADLLPVLEFIQGTDSEDLLIGDADDDGIDGRGGNDILLGRRGFDRLFGGRGDDLLHGGRDADLLFGDQGKDVLIGGHGNDYLDGGHGKDVLIGGSGEDEFLLRIDAGRDLIQDFKDGKDKLALFDDVTFDDLKIHQRGSSTVIQHDDKTLAVLLDADASSITADDFTVPLITLI